MGVTEITLPRLGETMEEARVTDWLVAPGDSFARGDILMEVETDKTVVEVPALVAGRMVDHLAEVGDQVEIGQPIARIETEGAGTIPEAPVAGTIPEAPAPTPEAARPEVSPASPPEPAEHVQGTHRLRASPKARRAARNAGVALDSVTGTGRHGRITGADVEGMAQTAATDRPRVPVSGGHVVHDHFAPMGGVAGAPVVLLHGLFATASAWRDLPRKIAAQGHPVLVPDLPGHGDSKMALADLDAVLRATRDFLDAVLPDGPVILVGHSMGAYVAAHLAETLGARVQRLILLAPLGLGARVSPDFLETMTEARTPEALARGLAWLGPEAAGLSAAALDLELSRAGSERATRRMLVEALAAGGVQQRALAGRLGPVADRTGAVFGLEDRLIDWRDAATLPADVAVHFVKDAGHLPQLTAGGLILRLIGS